MKGAGLSRKEKRRLARIVAALAMFAAVFIADKIFSGSRGFGMEAVEICDTNAENKEEKKNGQNV